MIELIPLEYPKTIENLSAKHAEDFFVFAFEQGQDKEILEKFYKKFLESQKNKKNDKYCLVSPEHYEHLNQFTWYIDTRNGYVQRHSNDGTSRTMHQYIMKEILRKKFTRQNPIDHLNRCRWDQRHQNLEISTHTKNARNRTKIENCSSEYFGVCKITRNSKVTCIARFRVNEQLTLNAYYDIEIHAAYQYNLWADEHNIPGTNKNDIDEIPDNFKEWIKPEKNDPDLPVGITRRGELFRIAPTIDGKRVGSSYDSLKKAKFELNNILNKEKTKKLQIILTTPIVKNDKDQCVIELFDKKGKKVGETIVDEVIYYLLKMFPICLSKGRAMIRVNGKLMLLARFIMKYHGIDYVDHKNRNPLDNRIDNLRILTPLQNSWNRGPGKNSISGYVGVCPSRKNSEKWQAYITVCGKKIYLGSSFDNKEDAAKARDLATKEHYGEFGYLNFPEVVPDLAIIDAKSI